MRLSSWILAPLGLFFLAFGLFVLHAAYGQNNPVVFLAMFFSSSLIVLLSLVSLVAVFMRTRRTAPDARVVEPDDSDRT